MKNTEIYRMQQQLNSRIARLEREIRQQIRTLFSRRPLLDSEHRILLTMPAHIMKTYLWLLELKEARDIDISAKTGRARAQESLYLNILANMGYCQKTRKNKRVIFISTLKRELDRNVRNET